MPRFSKLIAAIILATAAFVGAPSFGTAPSAHAASDEVTWSVRPADGEFGSNRSTLLVDGAPGGHRRDALTITNYSARELTLDVYAAPATLGVDGAPLAGGREEASDSDASNWVSFAEDSLTVSAGSSITVPFTVTVPFDAEPGDHSVALLTSWVSEEELAVDRRLGIRGYFRIGGELRPSASISDVRVDAAVPADPFAVRDVAVTFTLRNDGNMRLTGTADVTLRDAVGRDLGGVLQSTAQGHTGFRLVSDDVPDLGPGESVVVHALLEDVAAPVASVSADVEASLSTFAEGDVLEPVRGAGWSLSIPWTIVAMVLIIGALLILIPVLRRRARARFDQRVAAAVRDQVPEPVSTP